MSDTVKVPVEQVSFRLNGPNDHGYPVTVTINLSQAEAVAFIKQISDAAIVVEIVSEV